MSDEIRVHQDKVHGSVELGRSINGNQRGVGEEAHGHGTRHVNNVDGGLGSEELTRNMNNARHAHEESNTQTNTAMDRMGENTDSLISRVRAATSKI